MSIDARRLGHLRALPRDGGGPTFSEPWEAQAFAIAVGLSDAGYFSWPEWAAALARRIEAAHAEGDPDLGDTYYMHWLEALVSLCGAKGLVTPDGLLDRVEEWRAAYRRTPHGRPVELERGR